MNTTVQRADVPVVRLPGLPTGEQLKSDYQNQMEVFLNLCKRFSDEVKSQRVIRERSLFDFSKMVLWVIQKDVRKLPKTFDDLDASVSDYWRYTMRNDSHTDRRTSYIRLYQMVKSVRVFIEERELEEKADLASDDSALDAELIRCIHRVPGVTRKTLEKMLSRTAVELQSQVAALEREGLVFSRRSGDGQYYMLTRTGEALNQRLGTKAGKNLSQDLWDDNRLSLFYFLLELIKKKAGLTDRYVIQILKILDQFWDRGQADLIRQFLVSSQKTTIEGNSSVKKIGLSRSYHHNFEIDYNYLALPTMSKMTVMESPINTTQQNLKMG